MKLLAILLLTLLILLMSNSCQQSSAYALSEDGFQNFIKDYVNKVEPLSTRYNQAQWDAYISGKSELFDLTQKLSLQIDSVHQDNNHFKYLKALKEKMVIHDTLLKRQLTILYNAYLAKQINPELNKQITELSTKLENTFGNFRAEVDGKKLTDNDVTRILKNSTDSEYREKVWRAQKSLGELTAKDIVELAKLRNKAAKELGFENYYKMAMTLSELDPEQVENTFDELSTLSEKPFRKIHLRLKPFFLKDIRLKPVNFVPGIMKICLHRRPRQFLI